MPQVFKHYTDYSGPWPWKNFKPSEVACKHCGELYLDGASLDALQELRDSLGKPIIINSGHRCQAHNKAVGGTANSQHLKIAFDCRCPRAEQAAFIAAAKAAGFTGIGRYQNFIHLDLGPKRTWAG